MAGIKDGNAFDAHQVWIDPINAFWGANSIRVLALALTGPSCMYLILVWPCIWKDRLLYKFS